MGALINLIGQKYGKALVLEKCSSYTSSGKKLITKYKCLCDCGNTFIKSGQLIRQQGENCSCGKCSPQKIRKDINNIIGNKYGHYTVLELDSSKRQQYFEKQKGYKTYYICQCDCGTIKSVRGEHLINGKTQSCGCSSKRGNNEYRTKDNIIIKKDDKDVYLKASNSEDIFIIDLEDYELIKQYCWLACKDNSGKTRIKSVERKTHINVILPRIIMNCNDKNILIDHIDGDTLNNRKSNLRKVTPSQNHVNSRRSHNAGIQFYKNAWCVTIGENNNIHYLGRFKTYEEALEVRKQAEEKYFGEYSYKNSRGVENED